MVTEALWLVGPVHLFPTCIITNVDRPLSDVPFTLSASDETSSGAVRRELKE